MSFTVGKNFWEMKKPWNEFELDFVSLKRSLLRSRASAESSYSTLVPCWNMLVHWSLLVEKRFSNIFEEQGQRDFIEINNKIIIMVARTAGREWSGPWSGFFCPYFFGPYFLVRSVVRIFRPVFFDPFCGPDFLGPIRGPCRTKQIRTEKYGQRYLSGPVRIFGPVRASMTIIEWQHTQKWPSKAIVIRDNYFSLRIRMFQKLDSI